MQRAKFVWVVAIGLGLAACGRTATESGKVEPARVEPVEGSDLKRVVLTEKAAERLDIQIAPVVEEQVQRIRRVGGEIVTGVVRGGKDASAVWVRVPLSVSDRGLVDRLEPVRVLSLEDENEEEDDFEEAEGVREEEEDDATFDDDDLSGGVLYYEVRGTGRQFRSGELVLVELPLSGTGGIRKLIPYSAVIYDLDGRTWVYINPEPLVFVRHLVVIDYIEGDRAVLLEGPPVGTMVATVGVAELFGAETGVGK